MKLRDLEKLQSEIAILEARLVQLQEPTPATPLEGLPTAEILGQIQKNTELEKARLEERRNIELALPVLKERYVVMEKECSDLRAQLTRKMTVYQKAAQKLNSSLDGVLTQLEELRSLGLEAQATYQQAYGLGGGRVPIWTDNWHEHQLDFPAVVVLPDELGIRVVLTTQGLKPRYSRS